MWGRPVNFITFFVICPGQGRAARIARFIRGSKGWARSGQSSRQWDARIGTRRGRKRGRRGSGTREFIRGQDRCADMCSDLKSEMKIRRFESRKFIRGEDRSGRGGMHLCYPLLPTRIFEERRARKGSTQNRYFFIFLKEFFCSIFIRGRDRRAYSYGAGTHGPSLDAELQHFSERSHSKLSLPRVSSSRDGLSAASGSLRTRGKSFEYI